MSLVTNVVLKWSLEEGGEAADVLPQLREVNTFFAEDRGFMWVDDPSLPRAWYGGTKMLETNLFIGAFNYLMEHELLSHLRTLHWERPDCVELVLLGEDDETFRVVRLQETPKHG